MSNLLRVFKIIYLFFKYDIDKCLMRSNRIGNKKYLFLLILLLITSTTYSQKIGYEFRTNGKAYLSTSYAGFEIRHRTDKEENRFTYRYKMPVFEKLTLSLPLHYKVEKNEPTWEPRFIYKFEKFKLWAQQEFWFDQIYNLAIATDIPYKNYVYRVGWDTSNTIRFRISIKI